MSQTSRAERDNRLKKLRDSIRSKTKTKAVEVKQGLIKEVQLFIHSTQNADDLYEEVDDYRLTQDDEAFVEDDDKGGYIDNGEEEEYEYSDEYETETTRSGKKKKKKKKTNTKTWSNIPSYKGKRKRMTKQKQQAPVKPSQQINKFFSSSLIKKQTVKQPTKPKPVKKKTHTIARL